MKTLTKANFLPFTQDDILTLRGQPVAKQIETKNGLTSISEKWIYYNINAEEQECFSFKNGYLINWARKPIC